MSDGALLPAFASLLPGVDALHAGYVAVFGLAALGCLLAAGRARRIDDRETRRGLVSLLLTSGAWAGAQAAYLLAPTTELALVAYSVGLVVGLATLGPWLYFCSAFTGRTLHRDRRFQVAAVAVYLAMVALKVTNSWHGLYYTATPSTVPFQHVAIQLGTLHWLAMGLAYALAAVGYFMLFELFVQVDYDVDPLVALVVVTGLPVAFDVAALSVPAILPMNYEPVGVAAFAIGVLFVFIDRLQAIQLAAGHDEPVILLDDDGDVRDYNGEALALFPALRGASGRPLAEVAPTVAAATGERDDGGTDDAGGESAADGPGTGEDIVTFDRGSGTRYYRVSTNPFAAGRTPLGRMVVLTDVTEREQYRRELERQNERLEQFASMVSHDLRNPLNVAVGRLEIAREEVDSEHLGTVADALDRMEELVADVLALARQGQPIDATEPVDLATVAADAWSMVDAGDVALQVDADATVDADPDRLQRLFENLYRNALDHGGDVTTVRVVAIDGGFAVEDDGRGIPADEREHVFEHGYTTDDEGTGFGLSIVAEIVEAHGWSIAVEEGSAGGARFAVTGVEAAS